MDPAEASFVGRVIAWFALGGGVRVSGVPDARGRTLWRVDWEREGAPPIAGYGESLPEAVMDALRMLGSPGFPG